MLLSMDEFRAFEPKKTTYALFGWPLGHTMSPELHAQLFEASGQDADYIGVAVPPEDLPEAFELAKRKLGGINCTIPHKKAVIPLLDEIDTAARDLHSVNTVRFADGKATGFNTDILGFAESLNRDGVSLQGKKVLLCAGDPFRAAAADQLEIWANRAGVDIVRQNEGADPGAVLFDALAAAKARRSDVVLVDTAGRLHNKANLMKELAKLRKIIDRELPGAAKETLLVLDATTGQNGLIQARQFKETAGLTGIVLTKLDGTAKGGIVIAIAQELQVPVKYVGLGEGIKDLAPFDAKEFVGDLF